jgi:hypothetical protein
MVPHLRASFALRWDSQMPETKALTTAAAKYSQSTLD